ncbi:MAG: type II toxin-antitoxin system VapC family toxin [Chloroflexi bacterium]|nr:type II toxin-antitoxin system VapC family toxin [Chloroflexota bacterium]
MRLLLDTHVLLWWLSDTLPVASLARIADPATDVSVSAASVWEIAIKQSAGKLRAPADLEEQIAASGFTSLSIALPHALRAGSLPRHHADPFDRMLVAQAQLEDLALMTADKRLSAYDVRVLEI